MPVTIKFRRGTSSSWTSNGNIILASGEPGYELDTGRFKIGNGSTIWNNLPYATVVPSGFLAGSGISLNLANNGASLTINSSGATISNYGDNRVLTSDGTSTGINGESNLTFNGSLLNINGNLTAATGNFTSLQVGNIPVSISGHSHTSSNITDFNSSVSGLLPVKDIVAGTGIVISSNSGIYTIISNGSGVLADRAAAVVTTVFNKTANTINKGSVVYINGGQGDQPTIQLAIANGESGSSKTYGITAESIPSMSLGQVVVAGALTGFNTDQYNPSAPIGDVNGVILYLSPTTSGAMTTSKPYAPNHLVSVGTIVRTHQNEGVVEVRIQNGFELEELHNVAITGALNGQFLQYNSVSGLWLPSSSGNFTTLQVNNTGVSVSGHYHISSDITDFNISVSGLLPTISNSGNNRILTSTGSSVGINAENSLTFDGSLLSVNGSGLFTSGIIASGISRIAGASSDLYCDGEFISIRRTDSNTPVLSSEEYLLFDIGGQGSLTFNSRQLLGTNGLSTLDWATPNKIGILNPFPNYTLDVNGSGNFSHSLYVSGVSVSVSGHTHTSSEITNFNSSVSGLLPSVSGTGYISASFANNKYTISVSGLQPSGDYAQNIHSHGYITSSGTISGAGISNTSTDTSVLAIDGNNQITAFASVKAHSLWDNANQSIIMQIGDAEIIWPNVGYFDYATAFRESISGAPLVHSHSSVDITDFNSSVSGLLPTISNSGNNRVLTSTGSSVGINAESNLTFDNGAFTVGENHYNVGIFSTIAGGIDNKIYGINSFIGAGYQNIITSGNYSSVYNVITGGQNNQIVFGDRSFIGGGSSGIINGFNNVLMGGFANSISGNNSIICGGANNTITGGEFVTIVGGSANNNAGYNNVFILGSNITATQPNTTYVQNIIGQSGNFINLTVNNSGIALSGHTHTSSNIIDFNSSVSGLFPPNIATGVGVNGYLGRWNTTSSLTNSIIYDNGTKIGIGTTTPSELLDVSGTISANQFISKRDNNIIAGSGQIVLDGANGNRIDFNNNGIGPPSFTTNRSVGTKIVLAPNTSSTQTEYALGIEAGAMWFSIPVAASRAFQWYAGTANIATLFGNGTLDIKGNTSQINVDDLRLDNNVLSITTANSDLILKPNGNGSLVADTSGNIRGIYSNDFQRERTSPSGVASGSYSVICGGSDNRATGSYSIICGGQANTSTNTFTSVGGGDLNNATGNRSVVCGGGSNTSSAQSSVVGGGSSNQATGVYSIVPGGFRAKATRQGELSHAGGFFNAAGDAQHTILIARRLTTDATADVVLTLNGLAPASTNILSIPAQTMWTFSIKLSAYNVTNNESGWWIFRGGIRRNNANSTVLVGSLITESGVESTLSTASATVVADDINEALAITVTGVAAKNIRWVAVADISQVSYGTP